MRLRSRSGCFSAAMVTACMLMAPAAYAQNGPGACVAAAQFERMPPRGFKWTRSPDVTVLGHQDDPRVEMVRNPVSFWNDNLKRIGSRFRLGRVRVGPIPDDVEAFTFVVGAGVLNRTFRVPETLPSGLRLRCGTIVVVLTGRDMISFGRPIYRQGLALVGIKANDRYPFILDNVARNVIAHEIGHAIGIRHNADAASLMCGRPASCRPTAFESSRHYFFPLTTVEDDWLVRAYPQ